MIYITIKTLIDTIIIIVVLIFANIIFILLLNSLLFKKKLVLVHIQIHLYHLLVHKHTIHIQQKQKLHFLEGLKLNLDKELKLVEGEGMFRALEITLASAGNNVPTSPCTIKNIFIFHIFNDCITFL